MNPTRRTFFKIGAGGVVSSILGFDLQPAYAQSRELKISRTTETRSRLGIAATHPFAKKAKE